MERDDSSTGSPGRTDGGRDDDEDDSEWRFGEEEFEADVVPESTDGTSGTGPEGPSETGDRESRGSVAGGTDRRLPVEPESVDLENALFVLLGVVVTLAVFAQFVVG